MTPKAITKIDRASRCGTKPSFEHHPCPLFYTDGRVLYPQNLWMAAVAGRIGTSLLPVGKTPIYFFSPFDILCMIIMIPPLG